MNKTQIVGILVLLVALAFIFIPGLRGTGTTPPLTVVPAEKTVDIKSEISCNNAQTCIDYAISQGTPVSEIKTRCEAGYCIYTVPEFIRGDE